MCVRGSILLFNIYKDIILKAIFLNFFSRNALKIYSSSFKPILKS